MSYSTAYFSNETERNEFINFFNSLEQEDQETLKRPFDEVISNIDVNINWRSKYETQLLEYLAEEY